ncbi:4488_t:CDS:2 [Dentiscutata erythropus]|uniref:4488_t:CDS:1 n=1 Tax=Dentiscutata erythropus TaxID=1348616 RepID=A0A9N9GYT4_9GLOM|nr:4488_t:CDS:2 [Dentiscutata erythropus]
MEYKNERLEDVTIENEYINNRINLIEYESFEKITPLLPINQSSCKVFSALYGKSKTIVCLKTLRKNYFNNKNTDRNVIERFVNELTILSKLSHTNLVKILGLCQDSINDSMFLVRQYANGGSLRQHIQRDYLRLTWSDKKRIVKEIITGLHYIHNEGISHRNLSFYRESAITPGTPLKYVQLYRHCWNGDPNKRPTIEQMLDNIENINIESTVRDSECRFKFESPPNLPFLDVPVATPFISPRVDSIGWRNSIHEIGFTNQNYLTQSGLKPNVTDPLPNSRPEKSRSASFETLTNKRSYVLSEKSQSFHVQTNKKTEEKNSNVFNIRATTSLFDSRQPQVILVARYSPAKNIISVLNTLKKRGVNLDKRGIYKHKSVFHSLVWNDDLFDISFEHSKKLPRHDRFRAVLRWLISTGLDINATDSSGWTVLHEAIWKRKEPGVILALLENNANPNIPDNFGLTPLHQCLDLLRKTKRDDENLNIFTIIRILLHSGADPNLTLPEYTLTISGASLPNCLFAAVYLGLPLDIIELMIKRGADATSTTFMGLFLLDFASKVNNTLALRYLADNKNLLMNKRTSIFHSLKHNSKIGIPLKIEKQNNGIRKILNISIF